EVEGSIHLSNGIFVDPLPATSGTFSFNSTVLACAGSVTGVASMFSTGTYSDAASYTGSFSASVFALGGSCAGQLDGSRLGAAFSAVVTNVTCSSAVLPVVNDRGALATTFEDNPLTLNTC